MSLKTALKLRPLSRDADDISVSVEEIWSVRRSERSSWSHVEGLDIRYAHPDQVTILLGANVAEGMVQKEVRIGKGGQPVAVKTSFGWSLFGTVADTASPAGQHVMHVHRQTSKEDELNCMLKEWWATESFGTKHDSAGGCIRRGQTRHKASAGHHKMARRSI